MSRETTDLDVAVNLLWIAPGRVGGSEEYLVRQLSGLSATDGVHPTVYCSQPFAQVHPDLTRRYPTVIAPGRRDHRAQRIALEHSWLTRLTRRADVVHHGGGTAPLVGRRPIVVTVHDLQYLAFPQYFSAGRRRYLELLMPRSVHRAAVVTTPSAFVKATVVEAFDINAERVIVVPHGIPDIELPDEQQVADARRRHRIDDRPYVVYPAITHPHKGHAVLVAMLDELDDEVALVLLGGAGTADADLTALIASEGYVGRVIRPGRVSDDDRNALVAGAEALVFPSEYEGFGAPLVEAMALGTPVVCSDAAAIVEVVGDAALVVSERTGAAWADAVSRAMGTRETLIAAGHARRNAFTIGASGEALARAYHQAARS